MPDPDDRGGRGGRTGGRARGEGGDGGGDKKREDSAFEIGFSRAVEYLATVLGQPLGVLLNSEVLSRLKVLARSKQLGSAFRMLAPLLEMRFGEDEEVRAAIRGAGEGLAKGVEGADETQVLEKVNSFIEDKTGEMARLVELAKAGRLEAARLLSFEEAFIKLNLNQRRVIGQLTTALGDGGGYLKARFSAVGLQGIAEMLIARSWPPALTLATGTTVTPAKDPIVEEFRARFAPPQNEAKKKLGEFAEFIELAEGHLKNAIDDGKKKGVPFDVRIREGTNARMAGLNTYDAVRQRAKNQASAPGIFSKMGGAIRRWWQAL